MKILNFGSLNIDHVYEVPYFPNPGETLSSIKYNSYPGGKGLNQSVAIAKAGSYVYHAGKIGENSELLVQALQESGVDTTLLDHTGRVTGHAIIQVDESGDNCIIIHGGCNKEITKDYINHILSILEEDDILVLQNEINDLQLIVDMAIKKKLRIALNPSPMDESLRKINLSGITWLILNEIEGTALSGSKDPIEITNVLLEKYPQLKVVLTLGDKGAIYQEKHLRYEQPIFPVPVKDTTAAGDTFTGYFISMVASGFEVSTALKIAAKAASLAVSREGASSSIPTRDDVLTALYNG
ncbi:MAG: ribokinase [Herbinix sp.]|nr:ribokinase [Herbinix sp.]